MLRSPSVSLLRFVRSVFFLAALMATCFYFPAVAQTAVIPSPAAQKAPPTAAASSTPLSIKSVMNTAGVTKGLAVGLNDDLIVSVNTTTPLDPSHFALFLNGQEIKGLDDTDYNDAQHALIFHLKRLDQNEDAWSSLLGRPTTLTRQVSVALGQRSGPDTSVRPTIIVGPTGDEPKFTLIILSPVRLAIALIAIIIMLIMVFGGAARSTALRDNQLPQISSVNQTFSLGRCQMAFWFTLIFASYVFLYIILGDANVLSPQALTLMGISGTTALAAIAIDVAKDTPSDAVNSALRALGINSYADVQRINNEIKLRQEILKSTPTPSNAVQIQTEILDRQLLLRTYANNIQPFLSAGWFKDITTDNNGTALHRLQVVCWTGLLGLIFLFEVWRDLSMPQFSSTLLALMALSGAGYVGFKYPEPQQ